MRNLYIASTLGGLVLLAGCSMPWLGGGEPVSDPGDTTPAPRTEASREPLVDPAERDTAARTVPQAPAGGTSPRIAPDTLRNPERARELARRAHRAFDQGNLRASLSLFQRAAEQDPDSVEIQSNLGSLHFRLEEYRSAEAAYRRALAIDADDYFAHFYLGITHHRLGETTRARHHFQRALEIRPDSREARAWLERVRPGTSNGSPSS